MSSWTRTFWAVWAANFIAALGMQSFLPFFPSHLESLGLTDPHEIAVWAGLLYGAAPLTAALMGPLWGALGDRVGRKPMVLRAMLAIALFVGIMSFATSPWVLLALRVGQGVFSGFVAPSITLVSVGAPPERQGRVTGSLQSALALGTIGGPTLGAALAATLGTHAVFRVVSGAALLAATLVALLAREDASHRRAIRERLRAGHLLASMREDVASLGASRALRRALVLMVLVQLAFGATNPVLELYVRELGNGTEPLFGTGLLFSAVAVAAAVSMPLWGRFGDRFGHGRALSLCALGSGGAIVLHALASTYGALLGARVAVGLVSAGMGPIAFGVAAAETAVERRGGVFGAVFSARALALALGATTGGWLSAALGLRALFVAGGVLVWLGLLVPAGQSATALESSPPS